MEATDSTSVVESGSGDLAAAFSFLKTHRIFWTSFDKNGELATYPLKIPQTPLNYNEAGAGSTRDTMSQKPLPELGQAFKAKWLRLAVR